MEMVLVVVLILCGSITLSSACSCFPYNGPAYYCWYDVIFRGRAVAEYSEREGPIDFNDPYWEFDPYSDWVYTMQIGHALKMPEELKGAQTITMRTPMEDSLCGTRLRLDVDAIFFAYVNEEGEITTTHCAPNTAWESMSEEDQQYFNEGLMDDCANISLGTSTLGTSTLGTSTLTPEKD